MGLAKGFVLLRGDKPSAKARSSEELKFLSSQAALSYRAAVAPDAFIPRRSVLSAALREIKSRPREGKHRL